jgi:hypothetical protein
LYFEGLCGTLSCAEAPGVAASILGGSLPA